MPPSKGQKILTSGNEPVDFVSPGQVHLPKIGEHVSVPIVRLKTLMTRLSAVSRTHNWLENFGYALLGVGGGALVSAMCLWASVDFSKIVDGFETIHWRGLLSTLLVGAVGVLGLLTGGLSLYYNRDKRKTQADVYDYIIQDIDEIAKTCFPVVAPSGMAAHESTEGKP